jgi:hypothetical protein
MEGHPLYGFMKENGLTQKDEASFVKEYSDPKKAEELHKFFVENKLTEKDSSSFYDEYFKSGQPPGKPSPDGSGVPSVNQTPDLQGGLGQPQTGSRAFDPFAKSREAAQQQPQTAKQRPVISDQDLLNVRQEPVPSERMGVKPIAPPPVSTEPTRQQVEESLKKGQRITEGWKIDELKSIGADKYQPTRSQNVDLQSAIKSTKGKATVSQEAISADSTIKAVEDDYLDFLRQTNPDAAEYKWNEITAIREKAKKGSLNTKEEEMLRDFTSAAIAMRDANAEYNMLSIRQSSDVDVFQSQSAPIITEIENVSKQMQSLGIDLEGDNPPAKIEEYNRLVKRQNELVGSIDKIREQTGFSPEKEDLLFNSAKRISTPDVQSFVSSKYPKLEQQEAETNEKLSKRYLEAMGGNWEIARSFSGAVGNAIVGMAQIPKVIADITGNKQYGWTDQLYNATESFLMSKEGAFGRPQMINAEYKDLPLSYRLTRLFGEGAGSMATLAAGGSAGGATKIGQYLATSGAAFLTQEADSYKEAREAGMNEQDAAIAGTSVAVVTSLLEGLIPDIKYFEAAPFRKSVINGVYNGIKAGKGTKEAFNMAVKNAMDALPSTAKQYLVNTPGTGGKEAIEELVSQVGGDVTKEVVNTMVDNDYQRVWEKDAYTDAMLGGFLVGGGIAAINRPGAKSPVQEDVLFTATERKDQLVSSIEKTSPEKAVEIKTALDESSETLDNLKKLPSFEALPREKKAHVLSELSRKKQLEEAAKAVGIKDGATTQEIDSIDENIKSILDTGFTPTELEEQKVAAKAEQERVKVEKEQTAKVEAEMEAQPEALTPDEIKAKESLGEKIYAVEDVDSMLEEDEVIEKCPPGYVKAEHGMQMGLRKGGKWEIVHEFKGKSHKEGGIDIEIAGGKISYGGDGGKKLAKGGFWSILGDTGKFLADNAVGQIDPNLIKASDYNNKFFANASTLGEGITSQSPLAKLTSGIRQDTMQERTAGMTQQQVDLYNKAAAISKPIYGAVEMAVGTAVPIAGAGLSAANAVNKNTGKLELPQDQVPVQQNTFVGGSSAQDQQRQSVMGDVAGMRQEAGIQQPSVVVPQAANSVFGSEMQVQQPQLSGGMQTVQINGATYGHDNLGNFVKLT